jgi:glycosyltransferase involved in cell wall biosynthesis
VAVGKRLGRRGIETIVLFPGGKDTQYEQYLRKNELEFVRPRMPVLRSPVNVLNNLVFFLSFPFVVRNIAQVIRKKQISIAHVNGVTNVQPIVAACLCGIPVVWHWNDMLTPKWFVRAVSPVLHRRNVFLALATSAIGDRYGIGTMVRMVLPAPFVRDGSEGDHCKEMLPLRKTLGLSPASIVLGFVGHLVAEKGCLDFVKLVSRYEIDGMRVHGVIVGSELPRQSRFANMLRKYVESAGLSERIHFLGFRQDVLSLLSQFDVFVFPSYSEACPIGVLEAMAVGVPLVSTRVGEVPRMLGDTVVPLVEPGDIRGLVAGVRRMLSLTAKEKQELAAEMKARVEEFYSLESVSALHVELYQKVLNESRKREKTNDG